MYRCSNGSCPAGHATIRWLSHSASAATTSLQEAAARLVREVLRDPMITAARLYFFVSVATVNEEIG